MAESTHADGGIAAQVAFDASFEVRRLFREERQPIVQRRERSLRRQPDASVGLHEFFRAWRERAT